ncbi:hypothetical protein HAPG_00051 [Halorubrum phage GNf2]|nr:hypothetical protein HAPG_00051 [Halorubrum phage GNf2]
MEKFPKIRYPSDPETDGLHNGEVVVTEKLDGANFRFCWDRDNGLRVGSRNHTYDADDENTPKAFRHAVEYVEQQIDAAPPDKVSVIEGVTFYGEALHLHSLQYDGIDYYNPSKGSPHPPLDSDTPNVVLFDARRDGEWLGWDEFAELVSLTPFTTTEVLERGNPDELSFAVPDESIFGGQPEGIVARRVDGTVRAKKVTDDFKEKNGQAFNNPTEAQSDAGSFVAAYITDERVLNIAHKLVDEGEYEAMKMDMMADLPREVLKDAMAENGWELLTSGGFEGQWHDDFKGEVRSKASKKCARVLKTELQQF